MVGELEERGPDFLERLMRGGGGLFLVEAAIRLLIRHGVWLEDPNFSKFLVYDDAYNWIGVDLAAAAAALEAGELPGDEEDQKILKIAASLGSNKAYRISLRDVMEGIDQENIKHVAEAMMYADGFLESVADPRSQ